MQCTGGQQTLGSSVQSPKGKMSIGVLGVYKENRNQFREDLSLKSLQDSKEFEQESLRNHYMSDYLDSEIFSDEPEIAVMKDRYPTNKIDPALSKLV